VPDWIPKLPAVAPRQAPPAPTDEPRYVVHHQADGRVQITVRPHTTLDLPDLAGMSTLAAGWRARITITTSEPIYATPFRDEPPRRIVDRAEFDECSDRSRAIGLTMEPKETAVTLWISASFALDVCR